MIRPEPLLADRQGALEQRLGLAQPVLNAVQAGQAVEASGGVEMIRPERRLVDRQGALEQRLGLTQPALDAMQAGQAVEASSPNTVDLWRLCRVLRALIAIWAQFCNPLVEGARRQAVAFAIFCTTQAAGLPGLDLLSPDLSGVRWHDRSDDADVVFIVDPLAG
jgi:hypothetical protein